jgi:hypothetical protein
MRCRKPILEDVPGEKAVSEVLSARGGGPSAEGDWVYCGVVVCFRTLGVDR